MGWQRMYMALNLVQTTTMECSITAVSKRVICEIFLWDTERVYFVMAGTLRTSFFFAATHQRSKILTMQYSTAK
jgi:hypothetical protein